MSVTSADCLTPSANPPASDRCPASRFKRDAMTRSTWRLFAEFGDAVREPRDFPACCIAMHDTGARGTHECRLGFSHGGGGGGAVAGRDRLLDLAHGAAHAGAPRLVDHGAAGDLTGGLLGGFCISHGVLDENLLNRCVLRKRRPIA